jgi:hypothetical protein
MEATLIYWLKRSFPVRPLCACNPQSRGMISTLDGTTTGAQDAKKPEYRKSQSVCTRHESSGVYYGWVKKSGKQFRKSLKTTDRQLANRRLSEYRGQIARLNSTNGAPRMTFGELADRWFATVRGGLKPSSALRIETCIQQLKPFLGPTPLRNITRAVCDEWVVKRGGEIAASTFNKDLQTLRPF